MAKIFISYRREDASNISGRLYDRLRPDFGADSVFMDVDAIPYGADFRTHVSNSIRQTGVLLAIIGAKWLDARYKDGPKKGTRRLDDPEDFVRIEIETALSHNIPIIPVLVDNCRMPNDVDLPISLRQLVYRNAAEVRPGRDFHSDVDRLIQAIHVMLGHPKGATKKTSSSKPDTIQVGALPVWVKLLFSLLLAAIFIAVSVILLSSGLTWGALPTLILGVIAVAEVFSCFGLFAQERIGSDDPPPKFMAYFCGVVGAVCLVWTIYLAKDAFSWWSILTGMFAFSGFLGFLMIPFLKDQLN